MPVYTYHKTEIDNDFSEVDDDFWPSVNAVFVKIMLDHLVMFST